MKKADAKKIERILREQRSRLLEAAVHSKEEEIQLSRDDMPDDVDLASSEIAQSLIFRLRDRERLLLQKIEKTLDKITKGTFGVCESCGDDIDLRRLEARPVTTLCISCKEEQEHKEKVYA